MDKYNPEKAMRHPTPLQTVILASVLVIGIGGAFTYRQKISGKGPASTESAGAIQPKIGRTAVDAGALCRQKDGTEQRACLKSFLGELADQDGPETAIKVLQDLYVENAVAKGFCHQLAHEIGHAGFRMYGDVAEAFVHGDPFCWSGYHHGVMESYVAAVGYDRLPSAMNGICENMPGRDRYSFDYYNCVHGIGHGVMAITGDDIRDSLSLCDALKGSWEQHSCYGGVFMQNTINEDFGEHGSDFRKDDPAYPCSDIAEKYKESCYLTQTSHMLVALGRDFSKVFAACAAIPDKQYLDTCYRSIGRDASGSTVSDKEKTRDICLLGKDARAREGCVIGATKDFISFYHSDMQAKELCSAFDDSALREVCLKTATEYYKSFK